MFVAASTDCFPDVPLDVAIQRLVDLEYTRVEISIREDSPQLKPSDVLADLEDAVRQCRQTQRLTPVSYNIEITATGDAYYQQFAAICRLAKATKVVTVTMRAGELGTPFNEEIERLRELVRIATLDGVVVGLKTEHGHMTQDPSTAAVLCDQVKGLGITLDPSHYIYKAAGNVDYDNLFKYVCHTQLRDTSRDKLQVKIGQGEVEYSRLVAQLARFKYNRALSVNLSDQHDPDIDHMAEMRKMRLLLESLL